MGERVEDQTSDQASERAREHAEAQAEAHVGERVRDEVAAPDGHDGGTIGFEPVKHGLTYWTIRSCSRCAALVPRPEEERHAAHHRRLDDLAGALAELRDRPAGTTTPA